MKSRTTLWRLGAVAAVAATAPGCGLLTRKPQPPEVTTAVYLPFTANYRGVSAGRTSQFFDNHPTQTLFSMQYFVRVEVLPAGDGLAATFVLDSILLAEGARGGVSQQQVDSARGATFHAELAPTGRLTRLGGGTGSGSLAGEIADRLLKAFFPIIPYDGARAGAVWIDTLDTEMLVNGLQHHVTVLSEHSAIAWTRHAGERALLIQTAAGYDFSGSGMQSGRAFTVAGHGLRQLQQYIGQDGRYLGLVSADTSEGEARIADLDSVIPIYQTRTDSLLIR